MATSGASSNIPRWAVNQMRSLHARLSSQQIARQIRDRLLTDAERDSVLDNPQTLADMPQIWGRLRGMSLEGAVLDLALRMSILTPGDHQNLREALGLVEAPAGGPVPVPVWDDAAHELRFLDRTIKRIHRPRRSVDMIAILSAFQEEGWRSRIDDPLRNGRDPGRLRDTVRRLNRDLELIRFRADGTGEGIRWTLA
jgi:hypothetical protein